MSDTRSTQAYFLRNTSSLRKQDGLLNSDYFSVEPEGVDPMALRTIDYDKVPPSF